MVGEAKSKKKTKMSSETSVEPVSSESVGKTKPPSKANNAENKKAAESKVKIQENGKSTGQLKGKKGAAKPRSEEQNEEPMEVQDGDINTAVPTVVNKKPGRGGNSGALGVQNNVDRVPTKTADKDRTKESKTKAAPVKHGRPVKSAQTEVTEPMETNNNNVTKESKDLPKKRKAKDGNAKGDAAQESEDISDQAAAATNIKLPVQTARQTNGRVVKNAQGDNASEPPKKKARVGQVPVVHQSYGHQPGVVLVVGSGETGQLGLGPDIMDRARPSRVTTLPDGVVQVCSGGMHSACLTANGQVYTFGCNDEGALGRITADDDDTYTPGKVDFKEKIVLVSAGDSHTAALTHNGMVYICGTFRDSNGPIGIFADQPGKIETPVHIMKGHVVVKIASGCDHLVCLTNEGDIYTLGCAEQGQLGRVAECFSVKGGRKGLGMLLTPGIVHCRKRNQKFSDIWTGSYITFAKASDNGDIYAWGLNNYFQLGFADMQNKFVPEKSKTFSSQMDWIEISGGQHHTMALDGNGSVYSLGRKEYGRLGLGANTPTDVSVPTLVPALQGKKCVNVDCGSSVSFAVADDGTIYGWGMGSTKQLGQGDDEDDLYEPTPITGKQLQNKKGLMASAGGQHTIFLAQDAS